MRGEKREGERRKKRGQFKLNTIHVLLSYLNRRRGRKSNYGNAVTMCIELLLCTPVFLRFRSVTGWFFFICDVYEAMQTL